MPGKSRKEKRTEVISKLGGKKKKAKVGSANMVEK